jgi:GTP-binding protein EngB required for normal cell division
MENLFARLDLYFAIIEWITSKMQLRKIYHCAKIKSFSPKSVENIRLFLSEEQHAVAFIVNKLDKLYKMPCRMLTFDKLFYSNIAL